MIAEMGTTLFAGWGYRLLDCPPPGGRHGRRRYHRTLHPKDSGLDAASVSGVGCSSVAGAGLTTAHFKLFSLVSVPAGQDFQRVESKYS